MRIIHTSDWHLGKNLEGNSRLEEQERFLDFFVERSHELKPDLILIAGDIYDTPNPPAKAEKLFYDALKKLSREGDCLILVIAGNHDNPERLVSATPLATEHGIVMLGTPKTIVLPGEYGKHTVLDSGEGFVELKIRNEKAVVLAVPYPSEKRLGEVLYQDNEEEDERASSYEKRVGELFRQLEKKFREDTVNLTVTHLFVNGADPSGSERASTLGGSFLVNSATLPRADYTALGHIHRMQIIPGTDKKMRYSGSPIQYNISEAAYGKKFIVVDIDTAKETEITEVDIPTFKPIELWQVDSIEEAIARCEAHKNEESWIYLEIKTDRPLREDEIKAMKSLKKDILEIRPIIESIEQQEAADNIYELSFEEQFSEFYKLQNGTEPRRELIDLITSLLEDDDETD